MLTRAMFLTAVVTAMAAPAVRAQTRPAAAPTADPTPGGPPPLLADLRRKAYDDAAKRQADLPALPPTPLAAVAAVGRDGGHLRVLTTLATDGQARVSVPELPGLCTLNVPVLRVPGRPARAATTAPAEPDLLLLEWDRFDGDAGVVEVGTTVQVLPANVQLARTVDRFDGGGSQLQYTERRHATAPRDATGGDAVAHLTVADQPGPGRAAAPPVDVSADSFAALCQLHPAEVARHLEPVLRELHADADALPPDAPLAYQVFAADVPVDAALAARVRPLVAQLDADDFHARDSAGERLRAAGPAVAAALARVDPAALSPEQRARVAAVTRSFRPVADGDAARLRTDVDFLLNCLKVEGDPFVTAEALKGLTAARGGPVPFDAALAGRPRLDAIWNLRQQLSAAPTARP